MMCHLYFSRYKLFNYKYVHIVKPNVLRLNKDFLFSFFSWDEVFEKFGWSVTNYYYMKMAAILKKYVLVLSNEPGPNLDSSLRVLATELYRSPDTSSYSAWANLSRGASHWARSLARHLQLLRVRQSL